MKSVSELIAFFQSKLGCGYVWGSRGQICTDSLLETLRVSFNQNVGTPWHDGNNGYTYKSRCVRWIGKQVFDCSSMFDVFLGIDKNAQGYYSAASQKGKIDSMPDVAGIQVYKANSTGYLSHIGLYIGDGKIIEAKGANYGVIQSVLAGAGWDNWSYCIDIDYTGGGEEDVLQRGDKGDQVTSWQKSLIQWNPSALPNYGADGSFGPETEVWTKSFQKSVILPETGIVNTATFCKMLDTLNKTIADQKSQLDWSKAKIVELTADLTAASNALLVAENEISILKTDCISFSDAWSKMDELAEKY